MKVVNAFNYIYFLFGLIFLVLLCYYFTVSINTPQIPDSAWIIALFVLFWSLLVLGLFKKLRIIVGILTIIAVISLFISGTVIMMNDNMEGSSGPLEGFNVCYSMYILNLIFAIINALVPLMI